MRKLEKVFNRLDGKLLSVERDTMLGKYFLKIGLSSNWVYESIDEIKIEELNKTKNAVLLKVYSEDDDVVIDDLFDFVDIIIETNENIEKKEREFEERLNKVKEELKKEAETLSDELENMKKKSITIIKNKKVKEKPDEIEVTAIPDEEKKSDTDTTDNHNENNVQDEINQKRKEELLEKISK